MATCGHSGVVGPDSKRGGHCRFQARLVEFDFGLVDDA